MWESSQQIFLENFAVFPSKNWKFYFAEHWSQVQVDNSKYGAEPGPALGFWHPKQELSKNKQTRLAP